MSQKGTPQRKALGVAYQGSVGTGQVWGHEGGGGEEHGESTQQRDSDDGMQMEIQTKAGK